MSSKITRAAKYQTCIRCGADDGTICARHYNGPRQSSYGKGMGNKCHDLASAEYCSRCDVIFTEGSTTKSLAEMGLASLWQDKWERSEEFEHWILLTNIRRFESGVIGV